MLPKWNQRAQEHSATPDDPPAQEEAGEDGVAAARRRERGVPEITPDDNKRQIGMRLRTSTITGMDNLIDGLRAQGLDVWRGELVAFAVWHVAGDIADLRAALLEWRESCGDRHPRGAQQAN